MAVRCIYVLAFLLAFQVDGIALDGPIDDAAKDLKAASKALNAELAEPPRKVVETPAAKKLPLGVRECEKYPDACRAENLAKYRLDQAMRAHPEQFKDIKVEDTEYKVKVIKTETNSKKVESKVTATKRMTEKPGPKKVKEEKEPEEKAGTPYVKPELVNNVKPEKKAEPVKTAEPEKKAKKEKKDTDTWFDRTVLGVKLPLPKMPWELAAVEAKKTQFLQVSKGVERTVLKAGDGINFPKNGDTVTMHYTGTLTDGGKKFDSSVDRGQPFVTQIGVGQVIKGWDAGVVKMSLGEKAVLKMTADYGYGLESYGFRVTDGIPSNAGITFEVELLKIQSTFQVAAAKSAAASAKATADAEAKKLAAAAAAVPPTFR